jgi:addiction module RelE/StbE family toxin
MKVLFNAKAVEDLERIITSSRRIVRSNAQAVVDRIVASIERLASFPRMARVGQVADTHEWVIPRLPYIAVYKIMEEREELVVTGIFHGARDRRP